MPRLIVIALILGGVAYFLFRVLNEFWGGISGTKSAVAEDFKYLDQLVDQYELAPWVQEELDLISREHDVSSQSLLYANLEHGQFYSIYEEPIMAFATKEYKNNDRRLAVIKFNGKKYHFNHFEDKVKMSHNGKDIGLISTDNGLWIEMQGKKLHIDSVSSSGLIPLSINENHKISIATADEHTGIAGRMLHKIEQHDNKEGELIILSVAFALADKQI